MVFRWCPFVNVGAESLSRRENLTSRYSCSGSPDHNRIKRNGKSIQRQLHLMSFILIKSSFLSLSATQIRRNPYYMHVQAHRSRIEFRIAVSLRNGLKGKISQIAIVNMLDCSIPVISFIN